MLTLPAEFAIRAGRRGASNAILVQLRIGSQDLFFGTACRNSVGLYGAAAYHDGIIGEFTPASHSVDYATMQVEYTNCQVVISAAPQSRGSDGTWRRLTDSLVDVLGCYVWVRLHSGGASPALITSTFLLGYFAVSGFRMVGSDRFVLDLQEGPSFSDTTSDRAWLQTKLPTRISDTTTFPSLAKDRQGLTLPLFWGELASYDMMLGYEGLHPCEKVSESYYLVTDHAVATVGNDPHLLVLMPKVGGHAIVDSTIDSTHIEWVTTAVRFYAHILDRALLQFLVSVPPTAAYLIGVTGTALENAALSAAWDEDLSTGATVLAGSATTAEILFEFAHDGTSEEYAYRNSLAEIIADTAGIWLAMAMNVAVTHSYLEVWDGGAWVTVITDPHLYGTLHLFNPAYDWMGSKGVWWHFASGPKGGDGAPFTIRLRFVGTGWTAGVTSVATISELRWRCLARGLLQKTLPPVYAGTNIPLYEYWRFNRRFGNVMVAASSDQELTGSSFGYRGHGRSFNDWIDESGRTNPYSAGDPITKAQYIIESILRDELFFSAATIDAASFDSCTLDHPAVLSLPMGSSATAADIIATLCFEHGLLLFWSAQGKWTLRELVYSAGTPTFTVMPEEIVGLPQLEMSPVSGVYNRITVASQKIPGDAITSQRYTAEDGISIGKFGRRVKSYQAQTIITYGGISALAESLLDNLAIIHGIVRLEVAGWRLAGVQPFDSASLDVSLDPRFLYFGTSWASRRFWVAGYETGVDSVALELWDPLGLPT
jgi:hypothetical protein